MIGIKFTDGRTYITHTGDDVDGEFSREYRTDREGNGLWLWRQQGAEWKQIIGSGQITLRGAKSTIRNRFERAIA